MNKKLISVVVPCFNEEGNVEAMYNAIKNIFNELPQYNYENIFIDNASKDSTSTILKKIASSDKNVKVILNTRNFGHIRSPHHAMIQSKGDAIILIPCDFQEPPERIKDFLKEWENGYKIVVGVKNQSKETFLMFALRKVFYNIISKLSETELIKNFTGFGLYDKSVFEILKKMDDPYPYFRGLICEIGFEIKKIEYVQERRKRGITKNNFYTLYDMAMLGFVNHSKLPLRLASFIGFIVAFLSILIGVGYFVYKFIYWDRFNAGIAPLVIGIFFFGGVQLFFLGIIGEYIGAIFTQVKKRPLVIEKERINFEK